MSLYSSNLIILFPVGSCLFIAMRLADSRTDSQVAGVFRTMIYTISSLMICLALLGLLLRIGPINLIWLLVAPVLVVFIVFRSLVLGRLAVLLSFLLSMPQTQPLRMASDFARLNTGLMRRRAHKLLRQMGQGMDWASSLEATRIARTEHEVFWCRAVAKYGPKVLEGFPEILHPLRVQTEIERLTSRLAVLPWLFLGIPIVILILILVVPSLGGLAAEIGFPLEGPSSAIAQIRESLDGRYQLLGVLLLLTGFAFSAIIVLLVTAPQLIHASPFRFLFRTYHRTVGLISLATSGRREENLINSCRAASQLVSSVRDSRRLELSAQRLEQGAAVQAALVELGFLSRHEAVFLESSISSRSLAWALQEIAVAQTERMLRRLSAFTQVAVIVIVLSFAFLYGLIAHAMVVFVSRLILFSS